MVFYDLTSTYFEGRGPIEMGAHGHSRDGKPRNPQVLVGLVLVDGWPIAHHVFEGNRRDAKTVPDVLRDLEQRFGLKRIVFVGDRGMVTSQNLEDLRGNGHGYIVGRNRRRSGEVFDYIQSATGPWIECPVGITAREKATPPKTLVQEVVAQEPGVWVFVVHSEERLAYERAQRIKAMDRVRTRLEKLQRRIVDGRLKAAEKVGAAATRALAQNHGHLVLRRLRVSLLRASRPLRARAGLRGQIRYSNRRAQSVRSRRGTPLQRTFRSRAFLRQPQGRHRHAADLSSDRRARAGSHFRRCARLPASSCHREEAQGRTPRSLSHRSIARSPVRARRRHRSRQWHHQALRHPRYSARRLRAPRPRHHRPRSPEPATARPDGHVVTDRHARPK